MPDREDSFATKVDGKLSTYCSGRLPLDPPGAFAAEYEGPRHAGDGPAFSGRREWETHITVGMSQTRSRISGFVRRTQTLIATNRICVRRRTCGRSNHVRGSGLAARARVSVRSRRSSAMVAIATIARASDQSLH